MEEIWQRFVENFLNRLDGPLHFRFIVQPLMAVIFATLDGIKDAKAGKPAYFWAMVFNPDHRKELLRDGWKHVGKIFILAIILDVIYQVRVHHAVYPVETLFVALILAAVPYALLRGPVNRIVRLFKKYTGGPCVNERCIEPASRERAEARHEAMGKDGLLK